MKIKDNPFRRSRRCADMVDTFTEVEAGSVKYVAARGSKHVWAITGTAQYIPAVRACLLSLWRNRLIEVDGNAVKTTARGRECRDDITRVTDVDRAHGAAIIRHHMLFPLKPGEVVVRSAEMDGPRGVVVETGWMVAGLDRQSGDVVEVGCPAASVSFGGLAPIAIKETNLTRINPLRAGS